MRGCLQVLTVVSVHKLHGLTSSNPPSCLYTNSLNDLNKSPTCIVGSEVKGQSLQVAPNYTLIGQSFLYITEVHKSLLTRRKSPLALTKRARMVSLKEHSCFSSPSSVQFSTHTYSVDRYM